MRVPLMWAWLACYRSLTSHAQSEDGRKNNTRPTKQLLTARQERAREGDMGQISNQYRLIFLIFNLTYFAVGAVMLGFGIYAVVNLSNYGFFTENLYLAGAAIFIIVGTLKIVFSIVGIIAMFVKSRHLLFIYCWVLILLMLFTFVAAIYGFLTRPDAYPTTRSRVTQAYANPDDFTTDIINLQDRLNCCGVDGDGGINGCNSTRSTMDNFGQGCVIHLVTTIQSDLYSIGGIGMGFGIFELTSFLIAMQNLEGL